MGEFADLDDDLQEALDDAYGERIRVVPQTTGGTWRGQAGPDPDRAVTEIVGRYRSKPLVAELEGNREGSRFQSMTRMMGSSPMIRISPAQLTVLGYEPKAADKIVLLDRVDLPIFTVVSAGLRDSGEQQLELVEDPVVPS